MASGIAAAVAAEPAAPSVATPSITAPAEVAPPDRYATFVQMTAQIADQLARVTERLPGGRPPLIIGADGFLTRHASMLEASLATLRAGAVIPDKGLEAHEQAVLAFLNKATELTRLVTDLEKAETAARPADAAMLREEIAAFAGLALFEPLTSGAPATLAIATPELPGDPVYWPQTIHRLDFTVENRGDAPARAIALLVAPVGSVIAEVSDSGKPCAEIAEIGEGESERHFLCEHDRIGPHESWPLSVSFRHRAPDRVGAGPAEEVRVAITASAASPKIEASGDVAFAVANCSANYHKALTEMRDGEALALLERMRAVRDGDGTLPRRWLTRPVDWADPEIAGLVDKAGKIVSARGADTWLAAQANDREVSRVVYGLRAYVKQDPFPALCTGPTEVIASYRGFLAEFDRRRAQASADSQRAQSLTEAAIARLVALTAPVPPETTSATGDAPPVATLDMVLARLAAALGNPNAGASPDGAEDPLARNFTRLAALADLNLADHALADDRLAAAREALALAETAFYLDAARRRFDTMGRALDDLLAAIASAEAAHCRCRSSDYIVPPTTAAVPVPGIDAPPRSPRPRPRPVL